MSAGDVDLSILARPDEPSRVPRPRGRWIWVLVPVVIALGFLLVGLDRIRSLLEDRVPVTLVRPRVADAAAVAPGELVIQAAGWIEPDPFSVKVPALEPGVVRRMLVEESDSVKASDPVAELVDDEARLAVSLAEAALARARANVDLARAERDNARAAFDAAIEVSEARDVATADLAARTAELARREAARAEARAAVEVAVNELETQRFLEEEGAIGPWQRELAEARLSEARARIDERAATEARARAEVSLGEAVLRRAESDFELRLVETLRVESSVAMFDRAEAIAREVELSLARARLRLDRMIVRSPVDGVVLARNGQPGSIVGPTAESTDLCELYDPSALRVRVDVPQSQIGRASVGQRVEIRCEARPDRPYSGRVLRVVESADIQKVTVELQARVLDPDGRLKPEMLCQVSVFGAAATTTGADRASPDRPVRIPSRCLVGPDAVWVLDGESARAVLRRVATGARIDDEVLITSGLNLSDKVIDRGASAVSEGARVEVERTP